MPDQKSIDLSMPDQKAVDLSAPNAGSSGASAGAAAAVISSKPWTSAPTAAFNTAPPRYTGYGISSTMSDLKGLSDPPALSSSGASGGTAASTQPSTNSFWSTAHNGAFHSALVKARRDAERTRPYNQNDWKAASDGKRTQSGAAVREQYLPPEQIGDLKEAPRDRQEREQRDRMQLSQGDQREIARLKRALDLSKDKKHG